MEAAKTDPRGDFQAGIVVRISALVCKTHATASQEEKCQLQLKYTLQIPYLIVT